MTRTLRILYFAQEFWPLVGGIEVIAARLLPALVKRGHAVEVITAHGPDGLLEEDELDGVRIHRFVLDDGEPRLQLERFSAARSRIKAILETFRPDVIHVNSISPLLFAVLGPAASRTPLVVSIHSDLATMLQGGVDTVAGRVLNRAAWVTACSAAVLEDIRQSAPSVVARSSALHGFLPVPPVAPMPLPFAPPIVLAIARLIPKKGIDVLIHAIARLISRIPEVQLVIAGDGELRASLEAQARSAGLDGRVRFLGRVPPDRIWNVINGATLVAVPSRLEPFGMVALEAAAMARPVAATRVGGLPEAVVDGETGILVTPEDVDDLARGIASVLERPAYAAALGEQGRRRILAHFAEDSMIATYESLYREAAKRSAKDGHPQD